MNKNKHRYLITILLSFLLFFNSNNLIYASENPDKMDYEKMIVSQLDACRPEWGYIPQSSEFVSLSDDWNSLLTNHIITYSETTRFHIEESLLDTSNPNYTIICNSIAGINEALRFSFIDFDPNSRHFYQEISDQTIVKASDTMKNDLFREISEFSHNNIMDSESRPSDSIMATSSHGCGLTYKNVRSICSNNDSIIKGFYNDMVTTLRLDPSCGIDPWLSTASYWVAKVKNYGVWDYKRVSGFPSNFCCKYGSSSAYKHKTSEWLGNYNYGYTGKFLFSLSVLHLGSAVVSGMPSKDRVTDWPAIDEGYNDAP